MQAITRVNGKATFAITAASASLSATARVNGASFYQPNIKTNHSDGPGRRNSQPDAGNLSRAGGGPGRRKFAPPGATPQTFAWNRRQYHFRRNRGTLRRCLLPSRRNLPAFSVNAPAANCARPTLFFRQNQFACKKCRKSAAHVAGLDFSDFPPMLVCRTARTFGTTGDRAISPANRIVNNLSGPPKTFNSLLKYPFASGFDRRENRRSASGPPRAPLFADACAVSDGFGQQSLYIRALPSTRRAITANSSTQR